MYIWVFVCYHHHHYHLTHQSPTQAASPWFLVMSIKHRAPSVMRPERQDPHRLQVVLCDLQKNHSTAPECLRTETKETSSSLEVKGAEAVTRAAIGHKTHRRPSEGRRWACLAENNLFTSMKQDLNLSLIEQKIWKKANELPPSVVALLSVCSDLRCTPASAVSRRGKSLG